MTDMNTTVLADRYRLDTHLARGGMADVYAATDELLGRKVAVKMLHANYATDSAFIHRFRREAQAAANLTHPTSSASTTPARTTPATSSSWSS